MSDLSRRFWPCFVVLACAAPSAFSQQTTPMVVDDLFSLEQLGSVTASPDGEWLAIVIARARTSAETYRDFPFAGDLDHADVWVAPRRGGQRRNITNGITDGSGYWNPVWSPDGKHLALLSTKGGDNVRPYVWERASGTIRRLTDRAADLQAYGAAGYPNYAMIWTDTTALLCAVLPAGSTQTYFGMTNIMRGARSHDRAIREWSKAERGIEPTASVLESGREILAAERPKGQLLAIDVTMGKSRVVAEGNFRRLLVSPTRRHVALLAETGRTPPQPMKKIADEHRQWDLWRTGLAILALDERDATAEWISDVPDPRLALFDDPPFHSWSPDGSSFAVIGKNDSDDQSATTLFVVSSTSGTTRRLTDRQLDVLATTWVNGRDLVALARRRMVAEDDASTRPDWWLIGRDGEEARNITRHLEAVPRLLLRTRDGRTMLGIAAGDLWAIDVSSGTARNLTDTLASRLQSVVWPSLASRRTRVEREVVLQAENNDFYAIEWTGNEARMQLLTLPSKGAAIAEFQPEHRSVVFTATAANGTFLWTGNSSGGQFVQLVALNEHVGQIVDAKRMLIDYEGVDGDSLKALLVLPVGYTKGKRYPLVTWVYGGFVVTDTLHPLLGKQLVSSLNLMLLPSNGYALLIPSLPLPPLGEASDPYIELPKGVMGAVSRAIDLGFADQNKLGIMGHSYGGYTTYVLVTYTSRFKAAIAFAGASDLPSLYGTFSPADRHAEYPHEPLFTPGLAESSQLRMGDTPWGNPSRYVFNSPYYFADRIQTPLMIVQGDMDYVPIQQGEEFFTALYRMGKKARFVRYWGEAHELSSPANIRDMWRRVFQWLEEHFNANQQQTEEAATVKPSTPSSGH